MFPALWIRSRGSGERTKFQRLRGSREAEFSLNPGDGRAQVLAIKHMPARSWLIVMTAASWDRPI